MKRLGQHFLKSKSAIKKIIDALEPKSGDTLIEVGAGHGELTEGLKASGVGCRVVAIEKDPRLINLLKEKFKDESRIKIVEGDALKVIPKLVNWKLTGNIPYYITGKLLRILSELDDKPEICVLTIQKEVAERVAARTPQMNRLSAIVQFWAEPEIISVISRKDFDPEPKVDSAIIKLVTNNNRQATRKQNLSYYRTVKVLFAQPRKTILNNLLSKNSTGPERNRETIINSLKKMKINPISRPQNLNADDIVKVSLWIKDQDGDRHKAQ